MGPYDGMIATTDASVYLLYMGITKEANFNTQSKALGNHNILIFDPIEEAHITRKEKALSIIIVSGPVGLS